MDRRCQWSVEQGFRSIRQPSRKTGARLARASLLRVHGRSESVAADKVVDDIETWVVVDRHHFNTSVAGTAFGASIVANMRNHFHQVTNSDTLCA